MCRCASKRGNLSIQSGDIVYDVGESDVDILLSRDADDQSATTSSHGATAHQQVCQTLWDLLRLPGGIVIRHVCCLVSKFVSMALEVISQKVEARLSRNLARMYNRALHGPKISSPAQKRFSPAWPGTLQKNTSPARLSD